MTALREATVHNGDQIAKIYKILISLTERIEELEKQVEENKFSIRLLK